MRYRRIYALLKRQGHSPQCAAEIVLDAQRKQQHARRWIGILFKQRRNQ